MPRTPLSWKSCARPFKSRHGSAVECATSWRCSPSAQDASPPPRIPGRPSGLYGCLGLSSCGGRDTGENRSVLGWWDDSFPLHLLWGLKGCRPMRPRRNGVEEKAQAPPSGPSGRLTILSFGNDGSIHVFAESVRFVSGRKRWRFLHDCRFGSASVDQLTTPSFRYGSSSARIMRKSPWDEVERDRTAGHPSVFCRPGRF